MYNWVTLHGVNFNVPVQLLCFLNIKCKNFVIASEISPFLVGYSFLQQTLTFLPPKLLLHFAIDGLPPFGHPGYARVKRLPR